MPSSPSPGVATAPTIPAARKRGRPAKISIQAKERALEARDQGVKGKELAAILYDVKRPTSRQANDVSNILKNYLLHHGRQPKKS